MANSALAALTTSARVDHTNQATMSTRCLAPLPFELMLEVCQYLGDDALRALRATSYIMFHGALKYLATFYGRKAASQNFTITKNSLTVLLELLSIPAYRREMTHIGFASESPKLQDTLPSEPSQADRQRLEGAKKFERSAEARQMFDKIFQIVKDTPNIKSVGLEVQYQRYWLSSMRGVLAALKEAEIPHPILRLDVTTFNYIQETSKSRDPQSHGPAIITELEEKNQMGLIKELNMLDRPHCIDESGKFMKPKYLVQSLEDIDTLSFNGCF
ncbi:hypothetical protein BDV96DRAFT_639067 [Lophiotrema nucula]|uniref:F-box domain-containing protein n=1 Tax=Lophiotrema nucula TaxID=690887 RepID=A0A6A5ZUB5_9PLEO|nr:hypothetical protein BDV96DRAFT_639067 [Lophiotrema nucula]